MRHLLHLPLLVDALHPVDLLVREEPRERFGSFGGGIITCAMGFAAAGKRSGLRNSRGQPPALRRRRYGPVVMGGLALSKKLRVAV